MPAKVYLFIGVIWIASFYSPQSISSASEPPDIKTLITKEVTTEFKHNKEVYKSGDAIDIELRVNNQSDFTVIRYGYNKRTKLLISAKRDGKEVPYTLYGRKMFDLDVKEENDRTTIIKMKEGSKQESIQEFRLNKIFDLTLEGEYIVTFPINYYYKDGDKIIMVEKNADLKFRIE